MTAATSDLLAAIVASTRRTVEWRRRSVLMESVERMAAAARPRGDRFTEAISRGGRLNVIAECKRRSPSRGVLRREYDAATIAGAYEAAGAAAISVLTEPAFFDGSLADLRAVRSRVAVPVLRKDFIVDDYQVFEAAAGGADAVLLIVAALDTGSLQRLASLAESLGLASLVEAHGADEVRAAIEAGARIIGINNRDLRTLAVDPAASVSLASVIPDEVVAVAECGLRSGADLCRLRDVGYDAFLVGERLVGAEAPGDALAALLDGASS
jgi:indole-3-glycerol phosphate synthase